MTAVFVASFKQQLHPKADTQQRFSFRRLLSDEIRHAGIPQFFRRVLEGANTGQNQPVGLGEFRSIAADEGFLSDGLTA